MFKFYEVGGAVRDELLGLKSKDIDYVAVPNIELFSGYGKEGNHTVAINVIFSILSQWLKGRGYEIFLETPNCYTIRAKFPKDHSNAGTVADFVLARKEIGYKEETREPIVVPGTLWDDLARRDFTVNAIAKDSAGNYIDPFNGMADLKRKTLRTPISGDITFEDDPLRLLRAIRFAVTKDFIISRDVHRRIYSFNYEKKFNVISEERIREELYKCFKHNTLKTLRWLDQFSAMKNYIFGKTNLWLKPTNEL